MRLMKDSRLLHAALLEHKLDVLFHEQLEPELKLYKLERGDRVCAAGENLRQMYFLVQGRLKVFITLSSGKSLLLRFCNPLSIIGDLEFITRNQTGSSVEAVTEGLVIGVDYDMLYSKFYHHPVFLHYILQHVTHKLETVLASTSVNQLSTVEQRFTNYLVSTMMGEKSWIIDEIKSSNLGEIAELLGTSYRHLNRVIHALETEGIVERKNGHLTVKNIEKLKQRSSEDIYK